MKIATRDFGVVDYPEENIINFVEPILGFQEYRRYILLCDKDIGRQFAWLQSADEPSLCFIVSDPDIVDKEYKAKIPESACTVTGGSPCECWNMTVIPEDFSKATVNLKSPVLINQKTRQAAQVVLEADYPIRCPLKKPAKEEAASC